MVNELSILSTSSFAPSLSGSVPTVVLEEISSGRAKEGKDGIEGSGLSNSCCLVEPSEDMVTSSGSKAVAFSGKIEIVCKNKTNPKAVRPTGSASGYHTSRESA